MEYAAFFRGINVGGKHIVKMAELKVLLAELGLQGVKTYIQSGNAVFASEADGGSLTRVLEQAFEARFGFPSAVIVRSGAEMERIAGASPFAAADVERSEREAPGVEHVYLYLCGGAIDRGVLERLCAAYDVADKLYATEREIYLLCRQGVSDSKLAALLLRYPEPLTVSPYKTACCCCRRRRVNRPRR